MADTYTVRSEIMPQCLERANIALFNGDGSGKKVTINRVRINNLNAAYTSPYLGLERLAIMTSGAIPTRGEDITADIASLDSTNPAASTFCQAQKMGTTVPVTPSLIKRIVSIPSMSALRARAFFATGSGSGNTRDQGDWTSILKSYYANMSYESLQPITLNANQSLIWFVDTKPYTAYYRAFCVFQETVSGGTYILQFCYNPDIEDVGSFTLTNTGTSSEVIKILKFGVTDAGDDSTPLFAPIPIYGMGEGTTLTPVGHDSNNSLPSAIVVKGDAIVQLPYEYPLAQDGFITAGMPVPLHAYRFLRYPRFMIANLVAYYKYRQTTVCKMEGGGTKWETIAENIVLNENEGLAIMPMCVDYTSYATNSTYFSSRGQRAFVFEFKVETVTGEAAQVGYVA